MAFVVRPDEHDGELIAVLEAVVVRLEVADGLGVRLGLLVFGEGPVDAGDGRVLSLALAWG